MELCLRDGLAQRLYRDVHNGHLMELKVNDTVESNVILHYILKLFHL